MSTTFDRILDECVKRHLCTEARCVRCRDQADAIMLIVEELSEDGLRVEAARGSELNLLDEPRQGEGWGVSTWSPLTNDDLTAGERAALHMAKAGAEQWGASTATVTSRDRFETILRSATVARIDEVDGLGPPMAVIGFVVRPDGEVIVCQGGTA